MKQNIARALEESNGLPVSFKVPSRTNAVWLLDLLANADSFEFVRDTTASWREGSVILYFNGAKPENPTSVIYSRAR